MVLKDRFRSGRNPVLEPALWRLEKTNILANWEAACSGLPTFQSAKGIPPGRAERFACSILPD